MYPVWFSSEEYAQLAGMTVPEVIRRFTIERVEDEMDADIIRQAVMEYGKNPKTYHF